MQAQTRILLAGLSRIASFAFTRTIPAALVLLSLAVRTPAQSTDPGQLLIQKKCGSQHTTLPPDKYRDYPELFNEIRVVDSRPDTSRIGIVCTDGSSQDEILFHMPVGAQLTEYLNTTFARPKGTYSLLIVLKNLWMALPDNYPPTRGYPYSLYFHVEAYLRAKDGFMPLISMDTTLPDLKGELAAAVARKEIRALLTEFMYRTAAKDLTKDRRIVSEEQIDSFNRSRFSYPMDTATRLVKGAYRSFDEFLQNAPSIEKAELSADKTSHFELHIPDENGQLYYTHSVWGYCDGSHAYVMIDGNLFPIFAIHHQFYVFGSKDHLQKNKVFLSLGVLLGAPLLLQAYAQAEPSLVRSLRVFRIDTGSGQVVQ